MIQRPDDPVDPVDAACRIGDAARKLRSVLDGLDSVPENQKDAASHPATWALAAGVRELLDAIDTVSRGVTAPEFTEQEKAFAIEAGISADIFTGESIRQAQDWLVWSAVREDTVRRYLERLGEMSAFDIVPGLQDVVAAFPSGFNDLDRFEVLRTPSAALNGLSPLRWLIVGGDITRAVAVVEDLGWLP